MPNSLEIDCITSSLVIFTEIVTWSEFKSNSSVAISIFGTSLAETVFVANVLKPKTPKREEQSNIEAMNDFVFNFSSP